MHVDHCPSALARPLREPLFLLGVVLLLLTPLLAMATGLDDRTLYGRSLWDKPLRFALSLGVFALTLSLAVQWLQDRMPVPGWRWLAPLLSATLVFETGWIAVQAARGVDSHFNEGTPFEALMFSLMGVGATLMSLAVLWLGLVAARRAMVSTLPAERLIAFGMALGFVGTGVLLPWTGEALVDVGRSQSVFSAAQALPLLGWRLDGTDPRPAHFVAAHMMQALPLMAIWLTRSHPPRQPAIAVGGLLALAAGAVLLTLGLMP